MIRLSVTHGLVVVLLQVDNITHVLPQPVLKTGTKQPVQAHLVQLPQSLHRVQVLAEHMVLT